MRIDFPCELQRRFEQAIAKHELANGSIVTIASMAERFQASTQDMERVLASCYRKGIVQQRNQDYEILGVMEPVLDSLFQHAAKSGMKPSSDVRAVVIEPASQAAADKLEIPADSPVYRLERTRNVNEEIVANQVNFIPYEVCPGLEQDDMTHYSFQRLLEVKYNVVFAEMKEDIFLAPGSPSDQQILGLAPESQVLIIDRLAMGKTNRPLVWADIHIRPDRYHYVAGLWPTAAALLEKKQGK